MPRTLLITGSSRGIGKATTEKLLAHGYKVLGLARREQSIHHENFIPIAFDLREVDAIENLATSLIKTYPSLSGIVLNAGIGVFAHLEELSPKAFKEVLHVNFLSQGLLIKFLLPHFKMQPRSDLIFITSDAALHGEKKGSIYAASKFALRGFAESLRKECATSTAQVTLIQPGMVRTSFYDTQTFTPGDAPDQAIEPEDIANAILFTLSMRSGTSIDQINLSPQKKVLRFKEK